MIWKLRPAAAIERGIRRRAMREDRAWRGGRARAAKQRFATRPDYLPVRDPWIRERMHVRLSACADTMRETACAMPFASYHKARAVGHPKAAGARIASRAAVR